MRLGYNTNGLAHHRLSDALDLLADLGYRSVAITLDPASLDPYQDPPALQRQLAETREHLERLDLACVVETGSRFLLNPRKKHDPTLLDPDPDRRAPRADFLRRAIDIASSLGAGVVSTWSGAQTTHEPRELLLDRLATELAPLLDHAATNKLHIGFEPEPGMLVERLSDFDALDIRLRHPAFQLTLDIGHVHCNDRLPIADRIRQYAPRIVNIHIEDMIRGTHDHLLFGAGEIDFAPVLQACADARYAGGLHVELSRHSHMGAEAARLAASWLQPLWPAL